MEHGNFSQRCLGLAIGLSMLWVPPAEAQPLESMQFQESQLNPALQRQMENATVRVLVGDTAGSGVIISRLGHRYGVLTNHHVVENSLDPSKTIKILAADQQAYPLSTSPRFFPDLDLALLHFDSVAPYPVAALRESRLNLGERVYAAGFPLYQWGQPGNTVSAGRSTFQLTVGTVNLILPIPLQEGYGVGYSNTIAIGMSGGPIFDQQGLLVGINGRSGGRDPGFSNDLLMDGTTPDPGVLNQVNQLNWGISSRTLLSQLQGIINAEQREQFPVTIPWVQPTPASSSVQSSHPLVRNPLPVSQDISPHSKESSPNPLSE